MEATPKSSATSPTVSVSIRMGLKYMAQGRMCQMVTSCVVLIQVIKCQYIYSVALALQFFVQPLKYFLNLPEDKTIYF